jgi:hypothetical protein
MSDRPKYTIGSLLFLTAIIILLAAMGYHTPSIQEKMDDRHLAKFAQKIVITDHVVASSWTHYPSRKKMSLSLTGENAKRVIQAVSSAGSGRPPLGMAWMNMYNYEATFYRGTNVLGEIMIDDGELFKTDGRIYRDVIPLLASNCTILRCGSVYLVNQPAV